MKIFLTDRFQKRFNKFPPKIQKQFKKRLELFRENPNHPLLKVHPLKGYLTGFRAFSVTGDYRVIYRILNEGNVQLIDIGTHTKVYE